MDATELTMREGARRLSADESEAAILGALRPVATMALECGMGRKRINRGELRTQLVGLLRLLADEVRDDERDTP